MHIPSAWHSGVRAIAGIFIDEWRTARIRHGWAVGRYVIMPDHVHFFAAPELDAKPLCEFMQFWKQWTSKRITRELRIRANDLAG